ncbi:double-strand break repair protein AddB [Chelativorans xinjiangense]|uniref:double-strand break repair protein AddB n=1 Tax=Chelativorans xinjiangense TaxID=2681485 RepID=UPI0013576431|nr:double-strand break repair protein AddB [Chelativorans xinjiangense]
MTAARTTPRVFSIPPGVPFLPALAEALLSGALVPGFRHDGDPLALAEATVYLPTRRAARGLRSVLVERLGGRSAILPVIRPLGEFEADLADLDGEGGAAILDHAPPIGELERVLLLAPLVRAWKARVPAHVAALFEEGVVVPASLSDSLWLARDLAALMDEIETEEADWTRLADLVPEELAGWWQVTLDFLDIVTAAWPDVLAERDRSNPAAHRNAMLAAEAARLKRNPGSGPVIAAGSTGSIPATARLLATIARLDNGAVVLPGLDRYLDETSWRAVGASEEPAACGHPQFGLKKLTAGIGIARADVAELAAPSPALAARRRLTSEALRPAETTELWAGNRESVEQALRDGALAGVSLVEAANEREEALAVAVALRHAVAHEGKTAALVTPDRALARRVAAELRRFGIEADDSGGSPLADSVPATLMRLMLEAVCRPGEPVAIIGLLKHPLLQLGLPRQQVRGAAELIDLVALRGGTGRPDAAALSALFDTRHAALADARKPFWFGRLTKRNLTEAREVLAALEKALTPLTALRGERLVGLAAAARASAEALEALARDADGSLATLYGGEAGEALARFLRELVDSLSALEVELAEWPDVFAALIAGQVVKPAHGADHRVAIWGTLEARLQSVDTLVLGGLNEGTWPQVPASDRFMSRLMKAELSLEPPERRIGLAAHDFMMALGAPEVVLSRSARAGDAPAVASRWLQRLAACAGPAETDAIKARGRRFIDWAHALETGEDEPFAPRPCPKPPLEARPQRFSITEIETLRRDPYAVYAKRILGLSPLDPLIRDPGAAERGTLFHDILQAFIQSGADPCAADALDNLLAAGRALFAEAGLPADVAAVWWPRFERTAHNVIVWERGRTEGIVARHAEIRAEPLEVGATGKLLAGRADRIDTRAGNRADIIDYKTGSNPSKVQAHRLLAPQLALEAALLSRGAFAGLGNPAADELCYVRLKANGAVEPESILKIRDSEKTGPALAEEAWQRLERLLAYYDSPEAGYLSRALPFKEGDMEGDYDHLARVLEWSAGGDTGEEEAE